MVYAAVVRYVRHRYFGERLFQQQVFERLLESTFGYLRHIPSHLADIVMQNVGCDPFSLHHYIIKDRENQSFALGCAGEGRKRMRHLRMT